MNGLKALVETVSDQVGKLATGVFYKEEEKKVEPPKVEPPKVEKKPVKYGVRDITTYVGIALNGYDMYDEPFDRNEVIREERWREVRKPYVVTDNDGTSKAWISRVWNLDHNEDVDDFIKKEAWEEVDRNECKIEKPRK